MKGKMSRLQRAKQFMPFAALKGFEDLLRERAELKEQRLELSDDKIEEVNRQLKRIVDGDYVRIVYYNGKRYAEKIGVVDIIQERSEIMTIDGIEIHFRDIKDIMFLQD